MSKDPLLPDIYNLLPRIIRLQDQELVNSPGVQAMYWDSVLMWDTEALGWNSVIGPEPILKTTMRTMQIELEKTAQEIEALTSLFDLDTVPEAYLDYIALQLGGLPLPNIESKARRTFLKNLIDTYQRKGTLRSFQQLFKSLNLEVEVLERYQRKTDFARVGGPQARAVSSTKVVGEPQGVVIPSPKYILQAALTPLVRGTVVVHFPVSVSSTPIKFFDNGEGGWCGGSCGQAQGSIDYSSGRIELNIPSLAISLNSEIFIDYEFQSDPFPDLAETRWVDRDRSSYVAVTLFPRAVQVSGALAEKAGAYVDLLKPAHVILDVVSFVFELSSDEQPNEGSEISVMALGRVETLFGATYRGYGWDMTENGSINSIATIQDSNPPTTGDIALSYLTTNPPTISRASGSFLDDGFDDDMDIEVTGTANNNSYFKIGTAAATLLTLTDVDDITAEGPVTSRLTGGRLANDSRTGAEYPITTGVADDAPDVFPVTRDGKYRPPHAEDLLITKLESVSLTFANDNPDTITRNDAGSFLDDGYTANTTITIEGSPSNDGSYQIATLTATELTLIATDAVTAETAAADLYADNFWDAEWDSTLPILESIVSNAKVSTTTEISIAYKGGTTLGVGDKLAFDSGVNAGEWREIQTIVDQDTYYTITVTSAFPFTPEVDDLVTLLSKAGRDRGMLENRPQEKLDLYYIEVAYEPDGIDTSFSGFTANFLPLIAGTIELTWVTSTTTQTTTDDGAGNFTATGILSSGTVNYISGAITLTFSSAPDSGSEILLYYRPPGRENLGVY